MNRERKFRMRIKSENKWNYFTLEDLIFKRAGTQWWMTDNILNDYTGYKDKNDKEIYEGDILLLYGDYMPNSYLVTVVYNGGLILVAVEDGYNDELLADVGGRWCEIVGNIIDNPELLEM